MRLEPLRVEHAEEMAPLLGDQRLHEFIGGTPPTPAQLRAQYERQAAAHSPDGTQGWLNWVVRHRATGAAVGTVQATLYGTGSQVSAQVAWVIAVAQQGNGYAKEAAAAMVCWLGEHGVDSFVACVHPEHAASVAVARHLGLIATGAREDGEIRWTS